jgi:hypothetical protein
MATTIAGEWLMQILQFVDNSKRSQQRHKKVVVDRTGASVTSGERTDATSTHYANRFPNEGKGGVVGGIVGDDGEDLAVHCMSQTPSRKIVLDSVVRQILPAGDPRLEQWLLFEMGDEEFLDLGLPLREPDKLRARRAEAVIRIYMPPALAVDFLKLHVDAQEDIARGLVNRPLSKLLERHVSDSRRDLLNSFLMGRETTFGQPLPGEVELELQKQNDLLPTLTDRDKCVLTLIYNMRRGLGLVNMEQYQAPRNNKTMTIGKGIDREQNASLYPLYDTLTRLDRMKVCARRAITLGSSGLGKIARGMQTDDDAMLEAGSRMIFNMEGKCWTECTGFTRNKESACSAILVMYMELMDYMVNPSPPLITRNQMRVMALYNGAEPYDERTWATWSEDKKTQYRKEYERFCARYMSVGFTFGPKRGPHGMRLLNLESWGEGNLVANPFRVREDTLLHKYFGWFRLEPNRLGLGKATRAIWRRHRIRHDFDPLYCDNFDAHAKEPVGKDGWYPRPLFDANYVDPLDDEASGPSHSKLYHNVPTETWPNGPPAAFEFREWLDSIKPEDWANMPFEALRVQGPESAKEWRVDDFTDEKQVVEQRRARMEREKGFLSREAMAMYNLHTHWNPRSSDVDLRNFTLSSGQVVRPRTEAGRMGSEMDPVGVARWRAEMLELVNSVDCLNADGVNVPVPAVLPPPSLNDPLLHPVWGVRFPEPQEWSSPGERQFPYPYAPGGHVTNSLFPVGEAPNPGEGELPPTAWTMRPTTMQEVFPTPLTEGNLAWDLRIPLYYLLGSRAIKPIEKALHAIEAIAEAQTVNDMEIVQQITAPSGLLYNPAHEEDVESPEEPLLEGEDCNAAAPQRNRDFYVDTEAALPAQVEIVTEADGTTLVTASHSIAEGETLPVEPGASLVWIHGQGFRQVGGWVASARWGSRSHPANIAFNPEATNVHALSRIAPGQEVRLKSQMPVITSRIEELDNAMRQPAVLITSPVQTENEQINKARETYAATSFLVHGDESIGTLHARIAASLAGPIAAGTRVVLLINDDMELQIFGVDQIITREVLNSMRALCRLPKCDARLRRVH